MATSKKSLKAPADKKQFGHVGIFEKAVILKQQRDLTTKVLSLLRIKFRKLPNNLLIICPFHKNGCERNASLSMHPRDGYYRCFACGNKGGDVIAFYRAVTGASFKQTIEILGAHNAR